MLLYDPFSNRIVFDFFPLLAYRVHSLMMMLLVISLAGIEAVLRDYYIGFHLIVLSIIL